MRPPKARAGRASEASGASRDPVARAVLLVIRALRSELDEGWAAFHGELARDCFVIRGRRVLIDWLVDFWNTLERIEGDELPRIEEGERLDGGDVSDLDDLLGGLQHDEFDDDARLSAEAHDWFDRLSETGWDLYYTLIEANVLLEIIERYRPTAN